MIYDSYMTQTRDALNEAQARQADRAHVAIIALIKAGLTQTQVATELGLTRQRISQIVQRAKARGLLS